MTTKQQATQAIMAKDANAHDIVQYDEKNFSARIGNMTGYYVILDGQITGAVWYE